MKLAQATFRRRRRQADRGRQRRQREPGQRRGAGPGTGGRRHGHRRAADPLPQPGRGGGGAGGPARPTSAAASPSTSAWWSTTSPCRGRPDHSGVVHGKLVLYQSTPEGTTLLSEATGHAAAGEEGLYRPPADRRPQLLHLRGPLHPRPARRRHLAAEQSGDGLHPGAGQGAGAADRGLRAQGRARPAGRAPAAAGLAGDGPRRATGVPAAWPTCSHSTRWCWPTCPGDQRKSISPTTRSKCWCATRSRWARGW